MNILGFISDKLDMTIGLGPGYSLITSSVLPLCSCTFLFRGSCLTFDFAVLTNVHTTPFRWFDLDYVAALSARG